MGPGPAGQVGQALLPMVQGGRRQTDGLDERRLAVVEALPSRTYAPAGEVAARAGLAMPATLAELGALEQAGLAEGDARGWRITRAATAPT